MVKALYFIPRGLCLKQSFFQGQTGGGFLSLQGEHSPLCFSHIEQIKRSGQNISSKLVTPDQLNQNDLKPFIAPAAQPFSLQKQLPIIMGILNVTPDSFSDGGDHDGLEQAVLRAREMVSEGADIIDIGGESTRPGAKEVPIKQELAQVIPVIKALRAEKIKALISIDSRKGAVMEQALDAGANIINDVSALTFDKKAISVTKDAACPVILMHAQGLPETMQNSPTYNQASLDIYDYLEKRMDDLSKQGLNRKNMIIDPGIGFGKTLAHNLDIIENLALYHGLSVPVLFGASRKGFIGQITGQEKAKDRVAGSVGVAIRAALKGVQILRVHDVGPTIDGLKMAGFARD